MSTKQFPRSLHSTRGITCPSHWMHLDCPVHFVDLMVDPNKHGGQFELTQKHLVTSHNATTASASDEVRGALMQLLLCPLTAGDHLNTRASDGALKEAISLRFSVIFTENETLRGCCSRRRRRKSPWRKFGGVSLIFKHWNLSLHFPPCALWHRSTEEWNSLHFVHFQNENNGRTVLNPRDSSLSSTREWNTP